LAGRHAAFCNERYESRHAQLHRLFDDPSLSIPLGERYAEYKRVRQLAINLSPLKYAKFYGGSFTCRNLGLELGAGAVEQRNAHSRRRAQHVQQVMGLAAVERNLIGGDSIVRVAA